MRSVAEPASGAWTDLRGATACEVLPVRRRRRSSRAGPGSAPPDPTGGGRSHGSPAPGAGRRPADGSGRIAGIGNVYRAEILFRHRIDPFLTGPPA